MSSSPNGSLEPSVIFLPEQRRYRPVSAKRPVADLTVAQARVERARYLRSSAVETARLTGFRPGSPEMAALDAADEEYRQARAAGWADKTE